MPDALRPLIVTDDAGLLDDLLRLAAAGGVETDVVHDAVAARDHWPHAALIVVGRSLAEQCVSARLPRRPAVVLVGDDAGDSVAWEVATQLGADHVVFLPAAEPWLVDRFTDCAGGAGGSAAIVAVVGGRGGAGASVLAATLGVTAARRGLRTLLVDGDPLGGGLDLILGGEDRAGLRWPDLAATSGRMPASELLGALPRIGDLAVLSWDRGDLLDVAQPAMEAVLDSARHGCEVIVADLPRRLDPAGVCVLQRADRVLLVVPAEVRACAAAARVAGALAVHCTDLQVVVRGPAPSRLPAREVASALGLPLAGALRPEPGLAAALERGELPLRPGDPLAQFCAQFLDRLCQDGSVAA